MHEAVHVDVLACSPVTAWQDVCASEADARTEVVCLSNIVTRHRFRINGCPAGYRSRARRHLSKAPLKHAQHVDQLAARCAVRSPKSACHYRCLHSQERARDSAVKQIAPRRRELDALKAGFACVLTYERATKALCWSLKGEDCRPSLDRPCYSSRRSRKSAHDSDMSASTRRTWRPRVLRYTVHCLAILRCENGC